MRIIFLGLPGSGKGTQARILAKKLNAPFVGMGDILRSLSHQTTPLAHQIKSIMSKGEFIVDDQLVVDIFLEHVAPLASFIGEGAPRSVRQHTLLKKGLAQANQKIDSFVYLDIQPDQAVNRLQGRIVCLSCGAPYGPHDAPQEGCCVCGASTLGKRDDDTSLEVIERRLTLQKEREEALVDACAEEGRLHRIDASLSPEETALSIEQKLVDSADRGVLIGGKVR